MKNKEDSVGVDLFDSDCNFVFQSFDWRPASSLLFVSRYNER